MIEFKNVSKVYKNGTHALNEVNIEIKKGEFVFIVGASGAGKSTFLKLMMREELATNGKIIVDGTDLSAISAKQLPFFRRKLGIVFQDFRLIPTMTVFDNVAFAMRVIGRSENQIKKRVPFVLEAVGLQDKLKCLPSELSGGEQQRVALARALVNNAEIIIADEPTGNVDPAMSREIIESLMKLNRNGTTVIMVTHEQKLVSEYHERVITLKKGEVVSDGVDLKQDENELSTESIGKFSDDFATKYLSFSDYGIDDFDQEYEEMMSNYSIYLEDSNGGDKNGGQ